MSYTVLILGFLLLVAALWVTGVGGTIWNVSFSNLIPTTASNKGGIITAPQPGNLGGTSNGVNPATGLPYGYGAV